MCFYTSTVIAVSLKLMNSVCGQTRGAPPSCCEHRELWESWCSLPLFPSLGMDSLLTCGGFLPRRCAISLISRRNILSGAPFLRCDQTCFNHIFPGVRYFTDKDKERAGRLPSWHLHSSVSFRLTIWFAAYCHFWEWEGCTVVPAQKLEPRTVPAAQGCGHPAFSSFFFFPISSSFLFNCWKS